MVYPMMTNQWHCRCTVASFISRSELMSLFCRQKFYIARRRPHLERVGGGKIVDRQEANLCRTVWYWESSGLGYVICRLIKDKEKTNLFWWTHDIQPRLDLPLGRFQRVRNLTRILSIHSVKKKKKEKKEDIINKMKWFNYHSPLCSTYFRLI